MKEKWKKSYQEEVIIYSVKSTNNEKPRVIVIHPTYISFSFAGQLSYFRFKSLVASIKWLAIKNSEFENQVNFNKNRIYIKRQSLHFDEYVKMLLNQFFQTYVGLVISIKQELAMPHCAWTRDIEENYIIYKNHSNAALFTFITLHKNDNSIDKIIISYDVTKCSNRLHDLQHLQSSADMRLPNLHLDAQSSKIKHYLKILARIEIIPLAHICNDLGYEYNELQADPELMLLHKLSDKLLPEKSNDKAALFSLHCEFSPRLLYFQARRQFASKNTAIHLPNYSSDGQWNRLVRDDAIIYETNDSNQFISEIILSNIHLSQIKLVSRLGNNYQAFKMLYEKLFDFAETNNDSESFTDEFPTLVIERRSPHFAQYFIEVARLTQMTSEMTQALSHDLQLYQESSEMTELDNFLESLHGFNRNTFC